MSYSATDFPYCKQIIGLTPDFPNILFKYTFFTDNFMGVSNTLYIIGVSHNYEQWPNLLQILGTLLIFSLSLANILFYVPPLPPIFK